MRIVWDLFYAGDFDVDDREFASRLVWLGFSGDLAQFVGQVRSRALTAEQVRSAGVFSASSARMADEIVAALLPVEHFGGEWQRTRLGSHLRAAAEWEFFAGAMSSEVLRVVRSLSGEWRSTYAALVATAKAVVAQP